MTALVPCPRCRRHVEVGAPACAFCGCTSMPSRPRHVPVGRVSRAALFAAATLAPACWTEAKPAGPPARERLDRLPAGTIRGVVRNGNTQQPMPRISISVMLSHRLVKQTTSDERGEYVFSGVAPGRYAVEYWSNSPYVARRGVPVNIDERAGVTLDLTAYPTAERLPAMPYGAPPRRRIV